MFQNISVWLLAESLFFTGGSGSSSEPISAATLDGLVIKPVRREQHLTGVFLRCNLVSNWKSQYVVSTGGYVSHLVFPPTCLCSCNRKFNHVCEKKAQK